MRSVPRRSVPMRSVRRSSLNTGLVFSCLLCLLCLAASSAFANTQLTAAQAIQIATNYCAAIGQSVSVPGTAEFPTSNDPDGDLHWQPRWQVTFLGQATLEIVDATGVISSYFNDALQAQEHQNTGAPGSAISQADAIQIATAALQATGQTTELTFTYAQELQHDAPPTAAKHEWEVDWARTFQGYYYTDDVAGVTLDAQTGQIKSVGVQFPSPPPSNTAADITVTQAQATTTAQAQLAQAGVQNAAMYNMYIEVICPNSYWQNGNAFNTPGPSRLAWVYRFTATGIVWGYVAVDAQIGAVIAGEQSILAGVHSSAPLPHTKPGPSKLKAALQDVTEMRVYRLTANPAAKPPVQETLIATLDAKSPQLKMLQAADTRKQAPTLPATVYRVTLTPSTGPATEWVYQCSGIGLLGRDGDWLSVPPAFNQWIKSLVAAPGAKTPAGIKQ